MAPKMGRASMPAESAGVGDVPPHPCGGLWDMQGFLIFSAGFLRASLLLLLIRIGPTYQACFHLQAFTPHSSRY